MAMMLKFNRVVEEMYACFFEYVRIMAGTRRGWRGLRDVHNPFAVREASAVVFSGWRA